MDQDPLKINWHSEESHCLINPRWPASTRQSFLRLSEVYSLSSHVWLCSSGSSSQSNESVKLVALGKKALLASARAVNERLQARSEDVWGLALPEFHVGGLSIYVRAALSQSKIVKLKRGQDWCPDFFYQGLCEQKVTLCSLVPAQLSDLVSARKRPPGALRALVVGGSALSPHLYAEAITLGWPVLPSFGMTEACSQVATSGLAPLGALRSNLVLLPHLQARLNDFGMLELKGESLLTGYAFFRGEQPEWTDPKIDGWYCTQDLARLNGSELEPLGRRGDVVQIGSETVNLLQLRELLSRLVHRLKLSTDFELVAVPTERLENYIALVHTSENKTELKTLINAFNEAVLPYERIRGEQHFPVLPRTELGKLKTDPVIHKLKSQL